MSRVEWSQLSGEDVEAVVAMLVYRERPDSTRITPSVGDGGVDILDAGARPDGSDVVLQVKRYAAPLTAGQRREVRKSFDRVFTDPRWKDLTVKQWRLVTPVNPSPEAYKWLQSLAGDRKVDIQWDGLDACNAWAAEYPAVVDYYLHGHREVISKAFVDVAAMANLPVDPGTGNASDVASVSRRVRAALEVLERDPHYRYQHAFGRGPVPDPATWPVTPGVVLRVAESTGDDGWFMIDVIARTRMSVHERPIYVKGQITAATGSEQAQQLEDFVAYGAGFRTEEGAAELELDAPGGLGFDRSAGWFSVGPALAPGLDPASRLRAEVLSPTGEVVAHVLLRHVANTSGQRGTRSSFVDEHDLVHLDVDIDHPIGGTRQTSVTTSTGTIVGVPVAFAAAAVQFLSHLPKPGHRLRLSLGGTPAHLAEAMEPTTADSDTHTTEDDHNDKRLATVMKVLGPLTSLQEHTTVVLRVPEHSTTAQHATWRTALQLLTGNSLTRRYEDGHALIAGLAPGTEIPSGNSLEISQELAVTVGDQTVQLGQYHLALEDATVERLEQRDDRVWHQVTTPGRDYQIHHERFCGNDHH